MSNHNKPRLSIPQNPQNLPPPPPVAQGTQKSAADKVRETYADLLDKYPLPWVVGPHGDVWVAADVESFDPQKESSWEKVPGPNGTWWRSTCARPRVVAEVSEVERMHPDMAAFIVDAVNLLA